MADHARIQIRDSSISCGVLEIYGFLSDAKDEDIAFQLASHLFHPSKGVPAAFVIWSDTWQSVGHKFACFLENEFYEELMESEPTENPRTGNTIFVWVWTIPHEKFKQWYQKQRIEKFKQWYQKQRIARIRKQQKGG